MLTEPKCRNGTLASEADRGLLVNLEPRGGLNGRHERFKAIGSAGECLGIRVMRGNTDAARLREIPLKSPPQLKCYAVTDQGLGASRSACKERRAIRLRIDHYR